MAISETQKVDYLWKKLGYGLSKTDTNANKRATNESIASPLLLSGENVWGQSDQIPATIPGSSSGVVTVYPTSSPDETTADTSATTNRTWKTELTDWIPPEFGSTYLVKAYIHTAGDAGNAASAGTQVFGAGSGNDDEWFFDYQSGILHFIGTNLPSGISGKSLYISGARYTGIKGVAVPGAPATFTNLDVDSLNVSPGVSTFAGAIDANGDLDVDGHTELDNLNVSGVSTFTGTADFNGDLDVDGRTELDITNISETLNVSGVSTLANAVKFTASGSDDGIIDLVPSGTLLIRGGSVVDGKIKLQAHAGYDNVICDLGPTELHFAASGATGGKKLETLGAGVSVYGTTETQQLTVSGVSTFTGAIDANGNLDVDGHTELDDVNVSGVSTFTGAADFNGDVDIDGHTELDNLNVSGVSTFTGAIDANGNLDVDGHTELDDLNVSDIATFNNGLVVTSGVSTFGVSQHSSIVVTNSVTAFGGFVGNGLDALSGNSGDLTLTSSDNGSSAGPEFKLFRDSDSPADADYLGQIKFAGNSDAGVERNYAKITGKILDASNTSEDGILEFAHIKAGSQTITGRFRSDSLQLLNSTNFSVDGTSTFTGAIDANGGADISGGSGLNVTGHTELDDVNVSGVSTFTGAIDANGGLDVSGGSGLVASTAKISDLNSGRVVLAGTAGELQDDSKLTFDGSTFTVQADASFNGNVSIGGTLTYEDVTSVDSVGLITARKGIVIDSGGLVITSGVATFTDNILANGNIVGDNSTNISGINQVTATTFVGNLTGTATTATNLADAANITTGTISDDRLPASITSDITGNAATASLATTATNLAGGDTGDIPYQSANGTTTFVDASGAGTNQVLLWSGSAPVWSNVSGAAGNFGGLTLQEEGSTVGSAGSVTGFNFVGDNITATASSGIGFGTITVSDTPTFDSLKVTGITTIPNVSGVTTFSDIVNVGSGITIYPATGIVSATQFYGGGQNLTDLVNQKIEGVMVLADGVPVGTGFTFSNLNFIGNSVSATGVGTTANITITGFDPDADQNLFAGTCAGGTYDPASGTACFNIFVGSCAGKSITEGDYNVFLGQNVGCANTTGGYNNFIGYDAGRSHTNGYKNNFFGNCAGYAHESGNSNNFIGSYAGQANVSGTCNNFIGFRAGKCATTTGGHNNFFGTDAGRCASSNGGCNNFIGLNAGYNNTTGANIIFLGTSAGRCNTEGDNNIVLGNLAGCSITNCNSNIFIGKYAGRCSDGGYNIFFGYRAGKGSSTVSSNTGGHNIAMGMDAGEALTIGTRNVFLGLNAGYKNTEGSCNVFLGNDAGCLTTTGDDNVYIGHEAGKTGETAHTNIAIGKMAALNATGCYNTVLGERAGRDLTGLSNVVIGQLTGVYTTSGCYNVFLGAYSAQCTSGNDNVIFGHQAGRYATTGCYNVFFGKCTAAGAASNNVTGNHNIAMGCEAGLCLTSGTDNIFLGQEAGKKITGGDNNIGLGQHAGCAVTSGCDNIFLGQNAGQGNTTGCYNIFFGKLTAGQTTVTGGCNIAMGRCAGYKLTDGCDNVFLGYDAGYNSADAGKNVFIGQQAGCTNTSGDSNIAIGCQVSLPSATGDKQLAIGNGSDRWIAGDSSFNVTIANKLLVNASGIVTASSGIVTYYGDGSQLSGLGESDKITENNTEVEVIDTGSNGIIKFTTEGSERARIDSSGRMGIGVTNPVAKLEVNVGSAVTALDIQGSAGQLFSVTNNLTSGSIFSVNDVSGIPSIDVDADGTIQLAPFSTTEMVGVGTTNPTTKLHVIGEVTATDFNATSDARLKTNVQVIDDPLAKVLQINGVSFNWVENNKPSMGVIADNIEEVLPELVSDTDPKTVNYNGLIGLLIEVVKDQQTQINSLNERLSQPE